MAAELTAAQLDTLRHMLGINDPNAARPVPYRDYYCAPRNCDKLKELERLGMVEQYSDHGGHDWYRCTEAGRLAAIRSHRTIRRTKAQRVYSKYLEVSDCWHRLTFKDFLTRPEFSASRAEA